MIGEMFFLGPSAAHLHALAESLRGCGFVVRSPGWLDTGLWGLTAYCDADQLGPYPRAVGFRDGCLADTVPGRR